MWRCGVMGDGPHFAISNEGLFLPSCPGGLPKPETETLLAWEPHIPACDSLDHRKGRVKNGGTASRGLAHLTPQLLGRLTPEIQPGP